MAERYSKVYDFRTKWYLEGAPLIIEAGALLKDMQTSNLIAQLKFQNISEKIINAVKVELTLYDPADRELEHTILYQYMDLQAPRDKCFGQQTPVYINDQNCRSFHVMITEVVFTDYSIWSNDKFFEKIDEQPSLKNWLKDSELVKQYQIKHLETAKFEPIKTNNLWFCTCGTVNNSSEEICHCCQQKLSDLFETTIDELEAEKSERLCKEADKKKVQTKKGILFTAAIVALVLLIVCCLSSGITGTWNLKKLKNPSLHTTYSPNDSLTITLYKDGTGDWIFNEKPVSITWEKDGNLVTVYDTSSSVTFTHRGNRLELDENDGVILILKK